MRCRMCGESVTEFKHVVLRRVHERVHMERAVSMMDQLAWHAEFGIAAKQQLIDDAYLFAAVNRTGWWIEDEPTDDGESEAG